MPPRKPPAPANLEPDASHGQQWCTAKSFATSYRFNVRNLEAHWYGLWLLVLIRLVRKRPDFLIVPQFPLYYTFDDEGDNEIRVAGQNPDFPDNIAEIDDVACDIEDPQAGTSSRRRPAANAPVLPANPLPAPPPPSPPPSPALSPALLLPSSSEPPKRDNECDFEGDLSIAKTIYVPDWERSSAVPDFCVFHSCTVKSKLESLLPFRFKALAGVQVVHSCCPLIVENKRGASRMLEEPQHMIEVVFLLQKARDSLYNHTTHYFQMYPTSRSVVVIAAAGEYWMHKVVLYSKNFEVGEKNKLTKMERLAAWSKLAWKGPFELGTEDSDVELLKVEKKITAKKPFSLNGH